MPRLSIVIVLGLAPAIAGADPAHAIDPAFLGIGFDSAGVGVRVTQIEDGTGAMDAGLQIYDEILSLDGVAVTPAMFSELIVGHQSGDAIHLDLLRDGRPLAITAVLSTRQEILHRRLVGRPAPMTALVDLDGRHYELGALRGQPAVIAWETYQCNGCDALLRRVATWADKRGGHAPAPITLAVTVDESLAQTASFAPPGPSALAAVHRVSPVPLAITSAETFGRFAISNSDKDRITFMVIDAHGTVVEISPIAAGDDDAEAAVDDVLAACEQAAHRAARH